MLRYALLLHFSFYCKWLDGPELYLPRIKQTWLIRQKIAPPGAYSIKSRPKTAILATIVGCQYCFYGLLLIAPRTGRCLATHWLRAHCRNPTNLRRTFRARDILRDVLLAEKEKFIKPAGTFVCDTYIVVAATASPPRRSRTANRHMGRAIYSPGSPPAYHSCCAGRLRRTRKRTMRWRR